jgi:hypothetical protein
MQSNLVSSVIIHTFFLTLHNNTRNGHNKSAMYRTTQQAGQHPADPWAFRQMRAARGVPIYHVVLRRSNVVIFNSTRYVLPQTFYTWHKDDEGL